MFIITTDHAGIPDIVEDGVNGIVISDVNQSAEIYKDLDRLSNSVMLRVINNNINYCRQNFMEKVYLSRIENTFDSILG